jgi:hypothetical protein
MSVDLSHRPAVVSRAPAHPWDPMQYLQICEGKAEGWTLDPAAATAFASMRDAVRAALRLPAAVRAFGLPLQTELNARQNLH